jgi:hypothetical protein
VVALGTIATSAAAQPPDENARIVGTLTKSNGEPVADAPFATGTLTFTAVDSVTGQRIQNFCANASGPGIGFKCAENGQVTIQDLLPGKYYVFTGGSDDFHLNDNQYATVTADQTTAVEFKLEPAGVIDALITDAVTNAPVENACVDEYDGIGGFAFANAPDCSGPDGRVRITTVKTGSYRIFVDPRDGKHGAQWVAPHGGVGIPALAKTFTVGGGQTVTVAAKLDGAGAITGTVADKSTGKPVEGVCAFGHAGASHGTETTPNCSNKDGKYVIGNLGPYLWPVEFVPGRGTYLYQWSGDQPSQLTAKLIKVQVGQSVVENARLVTGGTSVSGKVTAKSGWHPGGWVTAFNAITGDFVAHVGFLEENGSYQVNGVPGTQLVKLQYSDNFVTGPTVWYRESKSFKDAKPVLVRAGTPVTGIDIVVP